MEPDDDLASAHAHAQYNANVYCNDSCVAPDGLQIASNFTRMKENERINAVHSFLFALTSPANGRTSCLLKVDQKENATVTVDIPTEPHAML